MTGALLSTQNCMFGHEKLKLVQMCYMYMYFTFSSAGVDF